MSRRSGIFFGVLAARPDERVSRREDYYYYPLYRNPLIMPLFIVLGKLSDTAIADMKGAKERGERGEELITSEGGKLIGYYYTFGRYDFVAIVELPSAIILAKVIIEIGKMWGSIGTETMTAILPEDMHKMAMGT